MGMKRRAFKMLLKSGSAREYKKRHDEIWPDLVKLHSNLGVSEYSIFLDEETNILFAFQKVKDSNRVEEFPNSFLMKKWWHYVKDLMECNPDNSPVVVPLNEMFYMD